MQNVSLSNDKDILDLVTHSCFTPEANNPYPLCTGKDSPDCLDCCLYIHMVGEGGFD